MKALILAGGYGTRLRPLTITYPKSIINFIDKPIPVHQIEALSKIGVTEVIIALNHEAEKVKNSLTPWAKKYNIQLTFIIEKEPMGTAGCLSLIKDHLINESCFFMMNSDVICNYPFEQMIDYFKKLNDCEGILLTTKVNDPSNYGVIIHENGKIKQFIEKPKNPTNNEINAGIYLLSCNILKRVNPIPTSIEKEIFPLIVKEEKLYCYLLDGFWKDIGIPKDFLSGSILYLKNHLNQTNFISNKAIIGKNCKLGNNVIIEDNCVIGDSVYLENCILFSGTKIGKSSFIKDSIIGWNSIIGEWNHINQLTIFGENVITSNGIIHVGTLVLPFKSINEHNFVIGKIIM